MAALAASAFAESPAIVRYTISLASPEQHLVRITLQVPPGADERDLQLPVWNALYQVRDFAQYVNRVEARSADGERLSLRLMDKSRWRIHGAAQGAQVTYEISADLVGPFGMQLNGQHAFFNFAEMLMYPVDDRNAAFEVQFNQIPASWKIATSLAAVSPNTFGASGYDRLVDAPVELGNFRESDFKEGNATYRVVVDAEPSDYDIDKLTGTIRRIVHAANGWMNDQPLDHYLFIYHFPRVGGAGGMEHAYSTAIDVNAQVLKDNYQRFVDVTAHEFFHLWNVKRIRPQSLEPVDYTKENYTTALWFSEGVTTTAGQYILLRAGLNDEARFLQHLADEIEALEFRSAHLVQSAEQSSWDAWFEKYPYYRLPDRSISYYNKGDLLGVLLDLKMREASGGKAALRDLFHTLNKEYAQQGRYFNDSATVREVAESLSHADLRSFFERYVAGTEPIPWDDFFRSVGLHVVQATQKVPDVGFTIVRDPNGRITVGQVGGNSAVARAGLLPGDAILELNGETAGPDFEQKLNRLAPGDTVHLKVRDSHREQKIHWKVDAREEVAFELKDVDNITPQQKARRAAWLSGESESSGEAHP